MVVRVAMSPRTIASSFLIASLSSCSSEGGSMAGTSSSGDSSTTVAMTTGVGSSDSSGSATAETTATSEGSSGTSPTTTGSVDDSSGTGGLGHSPGCGTDPQTVTAGTIDVDGTPRSYVLVLPPDYDRDRAYPIVFGFHGQGGDSALAQSIYQLEDYWPEPVIVVYPQGLMQVGTETGWDLASNGEDIAFFDAMANAFAQELCLDLDRIYAMGFSFGAYMSNYLACYRGNYLRGIAAVGGGGPSPGDTCQSPVGAMIIHGSTDDVVPYSQGQASRNKWVAVNGCSDATRSWDPMDADGLPTECLDYQGCAERTTFCTHAATHTWRTWMNPEIPKFLAGL